MICVLLIGGDWTPSFAADGDAGETLFLIKCGRCHSPGRMATRFQGVKNLTASRKVMDDRLLRHFLKDAGERRLIIDYLVRLAKESR